MKFIKIIGDKHKQDEKECIEKVYDSHHYEIVVVVVDDVVDVVVFVVVDVVVLL